MHTIPKPYLRTIRVGTGIGHREQSRLVVLQLKILIYEIGSTSTSLHATIHVRTLEMFTVDRPST